MSGGKRSKQGTPQGGVISPLLANIYINRLLKAFAASDLGNRYGAKIVNYADDFVVVAAYEAPAVLARLKRWLNGMKLTLNETKTCIRDARRENFCFLGYQLGPLVNRRTGERYLGARPSKKALKQVKKKVSRMCLRYRTVPWEQIRDQLNQLLLGWGRYFDYGSPMQWFRQVDFHVAQRARNLLRRRHKLKAYTARFNYAGNLHVQFDERRGGNGLRVRLGESGERKRTLAVGADNPNQNRASRRLYISNATRGGQGYPPLAFTFRPFPRLRPESGTSAGPSCSSAAGWSTSFAVRSATGGWSSSPG
jgi:hypothetical protein